MQDYLHSVILGVVEGCTEFLPISSTAHLRISEVLLHIHLKDPFWKMYSIVIQLGAILCLPIYFRSRIIRILDTVRPGSRALGIPVLISWFPFCLFCLPAWLAALKRAASRSNDGYRATLTHPLTLVMIAFVCTAVPSFLLTRLIGKNLENLTVMGVSLLVGGIVMWIIDWHFGPPRAVGRHMTERMEDVSLGHAIWIGVWQVASAVLPGTSRSMATIAAGQAAGMSRTSALEFSFFLSMPTMVAATAFDLLSTFHPRHGDALGRMPVNNQEWAVLLIGFVVSFIVALFVVAGFMSWVRHRGFTLLAIYRIVAGIALLVWVMKR